MNNSPLTMPLYAKLAILTLFFLPSLDHTNAVASLRQRGALLADWSTLTVDGVALGMTPAQVQTVTKGTRFLKEPRHGLEIWSSVLAGLTVEFSKRRVDRVSGKTLRLGGQVLIRSGDKKDRILQLFGHPKEMQESEYYAYVYQRNGIRLIFVADDAQTPIANLNLGRVR